MRSATGSKKVQRLDDEYTIIPIDQTRVGMTRDLVYSWFPEGERPTLEVSGAWESVKLLGGVTDENEAFVVPCEDNFTAEITTRLLGALQERFGEKICVVLDNASYFRANAVHEYAEGTPIELCHFPRGSPELNPAEEYWRRLSQELGNQLFESLDQLRTAVLDTLESIDPPSVFTYLYP